MSRHGGTRGGARRGGRLHCLALGFSLGLAAAAPAAAQEAAPSDSTIQIARDLFERGKAKRLAGQYEEAAALLAASNQQYPNAGTSLLLADAYEQLGRLRSARDAFQLAAKLARESGDTSLEYRANMREAALLPRLPQLEIRVPEPRPPGLFVTLNGRELAPSELNVATALDAGAYTIEARAPGHEPFSLQLRLANDTVQQHGVRIVPLHLAPRGGAGASADPGSDTRTLAYWIGGAGGVLAAASVVMTLIALDRDSDSEAHCGRNVGAAGGDENACDGEGVRLRDQARRLATWATLPGVLGIAGLGAGLTLYIAAGSAEEPQAAELRWSTQF